MASSSRIVLTASIADDYVPRFLTNKLVPLMPYSLPLYRRCQFHLKELSRAQNSDDQNVKSRNSNAEIWVALSRPNRDESVLIEDDWCKSWVLDDSHTSIDGSGPVSDDEEHWLAAHIDLTNPGETQIWAFGSWESVFKSGQSSITPDVMTKSPVHKSLFQALFTHLRAHHIPRVPREPPGRWTRLLESKKLISLPYERSKVLFGCVSEALWPYLDDDVVYGHHPILTETDSGTQPNGTGLTCIARVDRPYLKYLIPLPLKQAPPLKPSGLHFAPLSRFQLQLMLDRSNIPRTIELLESLVSVGLFPDQHAGLKEEVVDPIAWGMLGKDASISSLHTEAEYRGRGLAESIVKQLTIMMDETFHSGHLVSKQNVYQVPDDNISFMHTDVSVSNVASQRVFEKIAGNVAWKVGWIEIIVGEM